MCGARRFLVFAISFRDVSLRPRSNALLRYLAFSTSDAIARFVSIAPGVMGRRDHRLRWALGFQT